MFFPYSEIVAQIDYKRKAPKLRLYFYFFFLLFNISLFVANLLAVLGECLDLTCGCNDVALLAITIILLSSLN